MANFTLKIVFHIIALVGYELALAAAYFTINEIPFSLWFYYLKIKGALDRPATKTEIFLSMFTTHFLSHFLALLAAVLILKLCGQDTLSYLYITVYIVEILTMWAYKQTQYRPPVIKWAHSCGTYLGILAAAITVYLLF